MKAKKVDIYLLSFRSLARSQPFQPSQYLCATIGFCLCYEQAHTRCWSQSQNRGCCSLQLVDITVLYRNCVLDAEKHLKLVGGQKHCEKKRDQIHSSLKILKVNKILASLTLPVIGHLFHRIQIKKKEFSTFGSWVDPSLDNQ